MIVQFGFTVGVTSMTDSGTWNWIFVVGEPSQPCGTAKVAVVYEFAAVDVAVADTCALAAVALPRTMTAATPRVTAPPAARRFCMGFLPGWFCTCCSTRCREVRITVAGSHALGERAGGFRRGIAVGVTGCG